MATVIVNTKWLSDDGWWADINPSHRGVWGLGDTIEEATDDLVEVLRGWHVVASRGDKFVECDCDWTYSGADQEGNA